MANWFKHDWNARRDPKIKKLKKKIKQGIGSNQNAFYFVVTFDSATDKAEFLEGIGINGDNIYITSKTFLKKLHEE